MWYELTPKEQLWEVSQTARDLKCPYLLLAYRMSWRSEGRSPNRRISFCFENKDDYYIIYMHLRFKYDDLRNYTIYKFADDLDGKPTWSEVCYAIGYAGKALEYYPELIDDGP